MPLFNIQEVHIHADADMYWIKRAFAKLDGKVEQLMSIAQDLKDTATAEGVEVKAKLDALAVEIQALKEQVANGTPITEAELEEVKQAIKNIFTPASPAPVEVPNI
jgi:phage-related minor tail protein